VTRRDLGEILSFLRQGVSLELQFGTRSIQSLLDVAETLERSVYEPDSLVLDGANLSFVLRNPPLRVGAFSSVRLQVDGRAIDPRALRVRAGADATVRSADSISDATPWLLRPGDRIEIAATLDAPLPPGARTVRLELTSLAIPPTVWMEIVETPRTVRA
jgi:hypothetical protein